MSPMPQQQDQGISIVIESHEQRMQRLESTYPELSSQVAEVSVQVEHAQSAISEMKSLVEEKFDLLHQTLLEHSRTSSQNMAAIGERLGVIEIAKKTSEEAVVREAIKKKAVERIAKKGLFPLLIAGTAIVTKIGEAFYSWILGLLHR